MATNFVFRGPGPEAGHTCELYHGTPYTKRELDGKIDPIQTVKLAADGPAGPFRAAFTKDPGNGYAIRLVDPKGAVYARSNTRSNAASKEMAIIVPLGPQEFDEAALNSNLELPEPDKKMTVDELSLRLVGGEMALIGHVIREGARTRKLTFDFRFQLKPVYPAVWTPVDELGDKEMPADTLEVIETSIKLDGDKRGHAAILQLIRPIIRRIARKKVQRGLHETLLEKAVAAMPEKPPPNATVPVLTIASVAIGGGKLGIQANVLMDQPGV